MRALPILMMPILALFVGPLVVLSSSPPADGEPLLVIAWPTGAAEAMIGEAGGQVIGPLRAPMATLATSQTPGFAQALRAAGAWAVIDGGRLAALCGENT